MWVSPRTRSMLGTIHAPQGPALAFREPPSSQTWLVSFWMAQWLQKMGKKPNAVQISWENSHKSLDFRGTKGTPFPHKANQLEPCILLVCPLGLKASRSCLALPNTQQSLILLSVVPRLESQETTEALLAVPAAGQHLVPVESGCWLQIIIAKLIPNREVLEKYVESHPHNWIHL